MSASVAESISHFFVSSRSTHASLVEEPVLDARWQVGERVSYQQGERTFQVERILTGGMAVVYVVIDPEEPDPFVVKTIKGNYATNEVLQARFRREVQFWIELEKHPNIVQARRFEYLDGEPHIFLEYVSNGSLREIIRRVQLPVVKVLHLAVEICRGMRHAVEKGITAHRDLKPDNILLTVKGSAKVTDFGLVKMLHDPLAASLLPEAYPGGPEPADNPDNPLTYVGARFGTKPYMPVEQWLDARKADIRADVYAFGVMLFEMLTGVRPFSGETPEELFERHANYQPPPPSKRRLEVPASVDRLVLRCLVKNPGGRYQSFAELEADLIQILLREFGVIVPRLSVEELTLDEINERGTAFYNLKRYKQALASFQEVLKQDPANVIAWSNRGTTLAEMGRMADALDSFNEALVQDPDNDVVLANKGTVLAETGQLMAALACYQRATDINRYLQPAWVFRAHLLNRMGRHDEAFFAASQARDLEPKDIQAHFEEARALKHLRLPDLALQALDRVKKPGRYADAIALLRAEIAYQQGRYADAYRLCAEVSHAAPEFAKALLLGVECALREHNLDEVQYLLDMAQPEQIQPALRFITGALDEADSVEAVTPGYTMYLLVLACEAAIKAGEFLAALRWYSSWQDRSRAVADPVKPHFVIRDIFKQKPKDGINQIAQGILLLELERPKLALYHLRAGVTAAPDSADGWRALGLAYNAIKNWSMAWSAFDRLARITPGDGWAWSFLAEAALKAGQIPSALDASANALQLWPDSALAMFLHGAALMADGKLHQAMRHLERALAADPAMTLITWNKGICARRMGRMAVANRCIYEARVKDVRLWQLSAYDDEPALPFPIVFPAYRRR